MNEHINRKTKSKPLKPPAYKFVNYTTPIKIHENIDISIPKLENICGELDIKLVFSKPVLVGKMNKLGNGVFFTVNSKKEKIIQGSTIRGLIRSVVEIITHSKMTLVKKKAFYTKLDRKGESIEYILKSKYNHASEHTLDFAETLFGRVVDKGENEYDILKGRVFFSDAICRENTRSHVITAVTLTPKAESPNYYNFENNNHENIKSMDIKGWKRYVVNSKENFTGIGNNGEIANKLNFIEGKNSTPLEFKSRIKFHNLSPLELGALVWALKWGDDKANCFHLIGRGKPQGMGRCKAAVKVHLFENNDHKSNINIDDCTTSFIEKYISTNKATVDALKKLALGS